MSLDVTLIKTCTCGECENAVYSDNTTHNLIKMANAAGIYEALWEPGAIAVEKAGDIVEKLENGLDKLKNDPVFFKQYDASNGWGTYEQFLSFVENYLEACRQNPTAVIEIKR